MNVFINSSNANPKSLSLHRCLLAVNVSRRQRLFVSRKTRRGHARISHFVVPERF
jgi:hypothetical protein